MAKKQGLQLRPKLISVAVASCFVTSAAFANPTGPTVVHGTANIQQIGNLLKITNSPNAIINWQSFSIGANEITRFIQQSQSSAVLNRVTGTAAGIDPSVILGALQSNGRVFLINPSGILFGAGAQVDVAGLVASSLNISNADFLANRLKFTDVPGAGGVVNQGNLSTGAGGNVYLVGPSVTNSGIITTPKGEVVLAAGKSVELVSPGTPNLRVEITAPDNEVLNLGNIVSEAGRVGIYAGLINNAGTISAKGAVAKGGKILLTATREVTLESTSLLDASGVGGGRIDVLSKNGGTVNVNGRLDASAPVSGNGGFIDTSADVVKVANGTVVTTAAPNGKTGTWLVDPTDYIISVYGGNISGSQLATNLGSTNVTLTSDMSAYGSYGGVFVNDTVSWNSGNSLTLIARNNVEVNSAITNSGSGGINLYAGWNGGSTASPVVTAGTGSIVLSSLVQTAGDVKFIAGNGISGLGTVVANRLLADGGASSVVLNNSTNMVNTIAGRSRFAFNFLNGKTLAVGTVGGVSGVAVDGGSGGPASVNIYVSGTSGPADLNVNTNVTAAAGAQYGGSIYLATGGSYGGDVNIRNASVIASGATGGTYGGSSYVNVYGQNVLIENSTVRASGSSAFYGGYASVNIQGYASSGNTLSIVDGSTVEAIGGTGSSPSYGGTANVYLGSSASVLISGNSAVRAQGRNAFVGIDANNSIAINNSTVSATGRTGADGGEGSVFLFASNGTINTGSSTVSAVGITSTDLGLPPPTDGGEGSGSGTGVFVNANGSVTLGLLSSNEMVSVFTNPGTTGGAIIDGNSGANISAPHTFLAGYGGVGTLANPLETVTSNLFVMAYGGEIGVVNSGNLALRNLMNFTGAGANAIGTTGTMTINQPISVSGDLQLLANNGLLIEAPSNIIVVPDQVAGPGIYSGGNLVLSGGVGDLGINGATVQGNNVTLSGNNVFIGFTTSTAPTVVSASNLMKVATAGNLNVLGGANSGANAMLSGMDVDLTVGTVSGFVNINGGANGASAQIHAGSPSTITLFFPRLGAGGYFINGVEGAISDGNTGFFANGSPAVLGQSLKITYGGAELPPPVQQGVDQVIASTNDPKKEPETNNTDTGLTGDGKEKKELPVCK